MRLNICVTDENGIEIDSVLNLDCFIFNLFRAALVDWHPDVDFVDAEIFIKGAKLFLIHTLYDCSMDAEQGKHVLVFLKACADHPGPADSLLLQKMIQLFEALITDDFNRLDFRHCPPRPNPDPNGDCFWIFEEADAALNPPPH